MNMGQEKDNFPQVADLPFGKNAHISVISRASIAFQSLKSTDTKSLVQEKSYSAISMNVGQEKASEINLSATQIDRHEELDPGKILLSHFNEHQSRKSQLNLRWPTCPIRKSAHISVISRASIAFQPLKTTGTASPI